MELERKIEILKAEENEQHENYLDAEEKYRNVAEMGRPSATYWYNYAVFLFDNREHLEQDQALKAINKALELKTKAKFYQLKYLILFTTGNLEEAKGLHDLLEDQEGQFTLMREYLNDNL